MSILTHVQARSYATKEEWLAGLDQFGETAKRTYDALRKATSDRQLDQREEAFRDTQDVEGVMETIAFGSTMDKLSKDQSAAIAHIRSHLTVAPSS